MFADIPGARIWYEDTGGTGVPLVLVHPRTGGTGSWLHQLPVFSAAGYRCIAYDRRGNGKTEIDPRGPQDVVPSEDLYRLAERLGVDRFHLLGTAAGGIVAMDFALSHPDRLRSLILANSVVGVEDEDYVALRQRIRPADSVPPEIRELSASYRALNPEGTRRWLDLEHASGAVDTKLPATRNRITFKLLGSIRLPTLLLTGDADLFVPPPFLKLFTERIRDSRQEIIPLSGHAAYWEQPEVFNRVVLEFLKKN